MFNYLAPAYVQAFIQAALQEDIGDGDHTSLSTVPADATGAAQLLVKDRGVLAGVELSLLIFKEVDPALQENVFIHDGTWIEPGQVVLEVAGSSQSILKAERLVLNSMQYFMEKINYIMFLQALIMINSEQVQPLYLFMNSACS